MDHYDNGLPPKEMLCGDYYKHLRATTVTHVTPTGFQELDAITGGLRSGELTIVGAASGQGKSGLAEQLALNISNTHDVLFIPLEMENFTSLQRLTSKLLRVPIKVVERDGIDSRTMMELNVRKLVLHDYDRTRRATIQQLVDAIYATNARVIIIDHARHIDGWISNSSDAAQIVFELTRAASWSKKHIVLCSQLNRTAYPQRTMPPSMSQLQDTSALEQQASNVWLLYRPFYHQGRGRDVVTELIVAKNRNGPACKIHYHWVGETMSLWPMTHEEEAQLQCCKR